MDIIKLLNEMESLVEETHSWGMGIAWNFHAEEYMDYLNKLRAALPDDIKRANRLNQESEKIVDGAREAAEIALVDAQSDVARLVRDAEAQAARTIQGADDEAKRVTSDATSQSQKMLTEATAQARKAVGDATAQAKKMLAEANAESQRLVNSSEVMRLATAQAREIVSGAEGEAQELRRGADEYAHGVLSDLERQVGDLMVTIQRGRGKLDQRVGAMNSAHANGRTGGELAGVRR